MTAADFLSGPRIAPARVRPGMSAADLVDEVLLAYNGGRLRDGARLLTAKMLAPDVTVGLALAGALTPAGLGRSCLVPLIEVGFIDWIVSTGANLYHDTHYALDMPLHRGSPWMPDGKLRDAGVVRIYDILFDYRVLLDTDAFYRELLGAEVLQRSMSSAELHAIVGKALHDREQALGTGTVSVLSAAWQAGVPIFTSSPGDSSIGMNIAALALGGGRLAVDVNADVNETAAIVLDAKLRGGKSAVWILGGGSPKNFVLQTEPQIQEVLGIDERGHDFFLQVTDARPDTGGLSGATPSEAVSWGKVDPESLPDAVVVYADSTIALPFMTAYVLSRASERPKKRLLDRRAELVAQLRAEYSSRGRLGGAPTTSRGGGERGEHGTQAVYPCGKPRTR